MARAPPWDAVSNMMAFQRRGFVSGINSTLGPNQRRRSFPQAMVFLRQLLWPAIAVFKAELHLGCWLRHVLDHRPLCRERYS